MTTPTSTDLDPRYGEPDAGPVPWEDAERVLSSAGVSWLSTVRPDGRPHVTTLMTVWHDGALHFCSGTEERKTRNLAANPEVALTTGANDLRRGMDVVVEGTAERVTDPATLQALADGWEQKYGSEWHYDVVEGGFAGGGGPESLGLVFRVRPRTAFGFGKAPYSQTRWRFAGS
jgi:general stress protein 26